MDTADEQETSPQHTPEKPEKPAPVTLEVQDAVIRTSAPTVRPTQAIREDESNG